MRSKAYDADASGITFPAANPLGFGSGLQTRPRKPRWVVSDVSGGSDGLDG